MKVIDEDWRFFISNSTSLRVNISPDFTVATLDFIHFDMKTVPRTLRSIGQPRLPICLRFCGLGTYFSPWYIDTNDVLMQSISQANEVCIFIDKAWINFIIELNLKLRKLRRYSLSGDLAVFVQNLLEERLVGSLGGVITQFCCFLKPDKVTALHPPLFILWVDLCCLQSERLGEGRDIPSIAPPLLLLHLMPTSKIQTCSLNFLPS